MLWRRGADTVEAWSLREVEVGGCYLGKTQSKATLRNLCQDRSGKPCLDPTPGGKVHSGLCLWGCFENYGTLSPIHGELGRANPCTGKRRASGGKGQLLSVQGSAPCHVDSETGDSPPPPPAMLSPVRRTVGTAVCSKPFISQASWVTDN